MLRCDGALVSSDQPPFEARDHAMHARRQFRRRSGCAAQATDFVAVAPALEEVVAQPAVGVDDRCALDGLVHERAQTGRGLIPKATHSNASETVAVFLNGYTHNDFVASSRSDP